MPGERIGFLGLGIMGSRMAANVAAARLCAERVDAHAGKGRALGRRARGERLRDPGRGRGRSEIVVSMVVDGDQVASVLTASRACSAAPPRAWCAWTCPRSGHGRRARSGPSWPARRGLLDAPVTGSSPRAEDGTLTIMVGGERAGFERVKPLLETMGRLVVHVGELGQGQTLKLINNSLGAANAAALAEALLVADAAGIDLDVLTQVVMAGSGASVQLELKGRAMREHDYTTLFKTAHMLKDVRLCLEEAEEAGVPFGAAAHAREVLTAAVGRGHGEDDYAALIDAIEGFAGRSLK